MEKELQILEEGPKVKIHLDSPKTKLKKNTKLENPKTRILVLKIHLHPQGIELNRCLQKTETPEWMTKGKTILIQEDLK